MPWVSLAVLIPLGAATLMLGVPGRARGPARGLALVASGLTLAVAIVILAMLDRASGELQMVDHLDWAESVGLAWDVGVDGISVWLVMLTAGLFFLGIVIACMALPAERGVAFLGLLLLAQAGLMGLFVAGDLILFYVFWEAMLIPFYFLIGMWGSGNRRVATLKFVIYTMVGSLLMLVAILSTAFVAQDITGTFTFNIQELRGVAFSDTQSTWLFLGFALAFAIKLPLWPFHAWLPDAYAAAPILVTGLLAAVMSKAGVYGMLRVGFPVFPEGADRFAVPIGVLAVVGIIWGSLLAWRAPTMRLLVAYSSLAHLGFIMLGIAAIDVQASQGAVLQMVNHGIIVAASFAIVGLIARGTGRERVDEIGGLAAGAPWLTGVFLIVTMCALAVPGSNAFAGEFFILAGVFRQHVWLAVPACIGIIYAAVYMLRLYQGAMNGPLTGTDAPRRAEMGRRDVVALVPLVLLMLFIALWPGSIVGSTEAPVQRALAPAQAAAGRPAEQIQVPVPRNPPSENLPLPGDPAAGGTATTGQAGP